MFDFQRRVVDEKTELDFNITKLTAFINLGQQFQACSVDEQKRLIEQRQYMLKYSEILGERIKNF